MRNQKLSPASTLTSVLPCRTPAHGLLVSRALPSTTGLRERGRESGPVTQAPTLPPAPLCFPRQVSITALKDPGSHILCLVPQPYHIDLPIQLFNWSVDSGF